MPQPDLEATLNCGVGMVAITPPAAMDRAIEVLDGFGIRAWVMGEVAVDPEQSGRVVLEGQHPGW